MDYVSRSPDKEKRSTDSKSCDLPNKEICDGLHKHFRIQFPKKEILMDYISKSHDLSRVKGGVILIAYISRSCDLPKKEILMAYISSLKIDLKYNFLKRKFDGLCKEV